MAYNEALADRLRTALRGIKKVEEKKMFRGVTFMINGKMAVSVSGENMMIRINPALHEDVVRRKGCNPMIMKEKLIKGFYYITPEGYKRESDFRRWLNLAMEFNAIAKSSKRTKRSNSK